MKQIALMMLGIPAVMMAANLVEGNAKSAVRVVIYEDLQCPDCRDFRQMMDEKLLPKYGDRVAFEHRDFPLAKHTWARRAAHAARFFELQNPKVGIEFRRVVMGKIKEIQPDTLGTFVAEFARKYAIDAVKAVGAMEDQSLAAAVEKDFQEGVARGVSKTPTIFVDGEPFIERFAYEDVAKSLDTALAAQKK